MMMIVEGYDEPYLVEFNYDPNEQGDEVKKMEAQEELISELDELCFD